MQFCSIRSERLSVAKHVRCQSRARNVTGLSGRKTQPIRFTSPDVTRQHGKLAVDCDGFTQRHWKGISHAGGYILSMNSCLSASQLSTSTGRICSTGRISMRTLSPHCNQSATATLAYGLHQCGDTEGCHHLCEVTVRFYLVDLLSSCLRSPDMSGEILGQRSLPLPGLRMRREPSQQSEFWDWFWWWFSLSKPW